MWSQERQITSRVPSESDVQIRFNAWLFMSTLNQNHNHGCSFTNAMNVCLFSLLGAVYVSLCCNCTYGAFGEIFYTTTTVCVRFLKKKYHLFCEICLFENMFYRFEVLVNLHHLFAIFDYSSLQVSTKSFLVF